MAASRRTPSCGNDGDKRPDPHAGLSGTWERFALHLKASGYRVTLTRKTVCQHVGKMAAHFRAEDLAAQLAQSPIRVSRGTVYRTLALMVEAQLVQEVRDSHRQVYYERTFDRPHHDHMVCDACGRFIEFSDAQIDTRLAHACRNRGFRRRAYQLVVFGTCGPCGG